MVDNKQIIAEQVRALALPEVNHRMALLTLAHRQAADLQNKSDYTQPAKFADRSTALSEDSNVNEAGVEGKFEGASVTTGRNGQTGGGTNSQLIPPEEGGEGRAGTQSSIYEDPRGCASLFAVLRYIGSVCLPCCKTRRNKEDIQRDIARNDPSVNRSSSDNVRKETGIPGERPQQQLQDDQEDAARNFA